ncbi:MAG: winged helix-turn-helix transcriptional regulator [Mycobacterium kyogaense]|uniref:winged helix-turn-helix transcriptional regulator n=1 Tax=Mycobacterium kyogaense TaxID=2212479 RepID=UPI002FF9915D
MLGVLGDEWSLLIIQQTLLGATRYGDFVDALPVSHAVLSGRLRALVAEGLLDRREYQTHPIRVQYTATAKSRSLWPMLTSIWEWERGWVTEHPRPLPAMRHTSCGAFFAPRLTCQACDAAVASEKELVAQWGPSGGWQRSVPSTSNRRRSAGRRAGVLFPQTMTVIGDRWGFALLVAAFVGIGRFTDFHAELGAPPATISGRLSVFTAEGILHAVAGRYLLTDKGRALLPVLVTALAWAQRWYPDPDGPAVRVTHVPCGRRFHPRLTCGHCLEPLRGAQIMTS